MTINVPVSGRTVVGVATAILVLILALTTSALQHRVETLEEASLLHGEILEQLLISELEDLGRPKEYAL